MPTHSELRPGADRTAHFRASGRSDRACVIVPARNEAATIGEISRALVDLREAGQVDRVLVVDDSADGTAAIARAAGADVLHQAAMRPDAGPVRGKGDAMWRAVAACPEEILVFVDGDTIGFDATMVVKLVAAIRSGASFAKANYRRPWDDGRTTAPTGGGRVTELTAKPLLRQLFPELATFGQPLAGEIAARRELLQEMSFVTGYGVDVALLIDAWRAVGVDGLAQVEATPRQNRHRPLDELANMADEVVAAILDRAGIQALGERFVERPAIASGRPVPALPASAGAW